MKKSPFSDAQIIAILRQGESGIPVAQLCREHGMSAATYYKWRATYGGLYAPMISQMKSTEGELRRFKKMYAELSLQNELLKEALAKKVSRPSQRKEMAVFVVEGKGVSVALACRTFGVSERCYHYEWRLSDENAVIADWLVRLTITNKTWGFGLCSLYLRNIKGFGWNHKRVYRIYRELELNLRIRPRKRLKRAKPDKLAVPASPNQVWSMDFMSDQQEDGRRFRTLNILDDFNREAWQAKLIFRCPLSGLCVFCSK